MATHSYILAWEIQPCYFVLSVKITYLNSTRRVFLTGPSPACWLGTSPKLYPHPDSAPRPSLPIPLITTQGTKLRRQLSLGLTPPHGRGASPGRAVWRLSSPGRPSSSPRCLGMKQ